VWCIDSATSSPTESLPTPSPTLPTPTPTSAPTAAQTPLPTRQALTGTAQCCWGSCDGETRSCKATGWCAASEERCTSCSGLWCVNSVTSSPTTQTLTPVPTRAPSSVTAPSAAPTPSPTQNSDNRCTAAMPKRQGATADRCATACSHIPLGRWPCNSGGPCDCGLSF
jgi:hypothetical protein